MAKSILHLPHRYKAKELSRQAAVSEPTPEAKRAQKEFAWFCEYLTREWPEPATPAAHHLEWHQHLVTEQDSKCLLRIGGPNVDLLAPRGSAKSTVLGLYVAWVIGIHTEAKMPLQILYISYSLNAARAKSATIKNIITTPEYRAIFPSVLKSKRWSDEYWSIDRAFAGINTTGQEEFTMICAGMAGGITSKRSHLVCLDDVIKNPQQIENLDIREKMAHNWSSVIRPTMLEGGRAICLGTRFRADDIHETTFIPEKGWIQIEQQAVLTDEDTGQEKSYWPSMWSLGYLQGLRNEDGVSFSYQYQNKVIRISDISIDPNWIIRDSVPGDIKEFDALVMGVDLSPTEKETSDYTCFVLGGRKDNRYYVLDMWRGRSAGNLPKLQKILDMCVEWDILEEKNGKYEQSCDIPLYLYCDDTAYQSSLAGDFRQIIINQHKVYNVIYKPGNSKGTKLSRLRGVSGLLENKLVTFNQYRALGKLIDELVCFGSTPHDDAVDSFCYMMQGLAQRARLDAG